MNGKRECHDACLFVCKHCARSSLAPSKQTHPGIAHGLDLLNLRDLAFDEFLAAEARVYGHDQDEITFINDVLNGAQRGCRVQHDSSLAAQVLDLKVCWRQQAGDQNDTRRVL